MKLTLPATRQFPHFIRNITAKSWQRVEKSVFIFFLSLALVNILYQIYTPLSQSFRTQILRSPFESKLHQEYGRKLLGLNLDEAKKEYYLSQAYYMAKNTASGNPLGIESSPYETLQNILHGKDKLEKESRYWEETKGELPDYVYTSVKLAESYFNRGETEKSKQYLEQAERENPGNKLIADFKIKMEEAKAN